MSNELKLSGGWTSPGGEVKLFTSDTANVSLKWHSKTTKSITLFGDSIETNDLCKLLSTMCKEKPENLVNDAVKWQGFDDFKQQMLEFTENMNTKMESLRTEVNQLKFKVDPLLTSENVVDELRNDKLSLMKENSDLREKMLNLSLTTSDLKTEVKDLEHERDSLITALKLRHSLSKHGLKTPVKSLFYLFVRVYAVLCTVHGQ